MYILEPSQVRELDRKTIEQLGLPGAVLMETAGRGVVRAIVDRVGDGEGRLATVFCGTGNNGGDGFVIARELHYRGFQVHVYVAGNPDKMSEEAALHHGVMRAAGVKGRLYKQPPKQPELRNVHRSLLRSAVIVDALVGVGADSDVREPVKTLIEQLDGRHAALTVSVDVPSGIDAQSGRILGCAVHSHLVVTMAAAKPGLFLGHGPDHYKELEVVDIGVPPRWIAAAEPNGMLLTLATVAPMFPMAAERVHKGSLGHLMVVAGAPGTSGAALLCAKAAQRSGVGLCTLATAGEIRARLESRVPDLMVEAVRGGANEAKRVAKLLVGKDALAVGPGMGTNASALDLVMRLLSLSSVPVVLDADALTALASKPDIAEPAAGRMVLTPHPGEMARLLGVTVSEVTDNAREMASEAAKRWQAVVVLKGPRPLVVDPNGRWAVCNTPNAALAKAGSGDVLCGIIAALLGRGVAPFEAAALGTFVHQLAGSLVRQEQGSMSSMASDLVAALARSWMQVSECAAALPAQRPARRRRREGKRSPSDSSDQRGDEDEQGAASNR